MGYFFGLVIDALASWEHLLSFKSVNTPYQFEMGVRIVVTLILVMLLEFLPLTWIKPWFESSYSICHRWF